MVEEIEDEGYIDEDTVELVKSAIDFIDVDFFCLMSCNGARRNYPPTKDC